MFFFNKCKKFFQFKKNKKEDSIKITPLPIKKVCPVLMLLASEAIVAVSIFSYVGFMIVDFGLADEKSTGYYAGLVASSFFIAQFSSSVFWGKMSDKYGRRPILLTGGVGSLISNLAFGFSFNLIWAVISRSLSGLLNGNIVVLKAYLGEVTDSTNQARAFAFIGLMWGIGGIIGSILGGLLSRPAVKYPNIFSSNGIFGKFPYLLPNLITSIIIFTALILAYFFITENPNSPIYKISENQMNDIELESVKKEDNSRDNNSDDIKKQENISLLKRKSDEIDENEENQDEQSKMLTTKEIFLSKFKNIFFKKKSLYQQLEKNYNNNNNREKRYSVKKNEESILTILKDLNVIKTCLSFGIIGFAYTISDEILPLWSMASIEEGGLGFNTSDIGMMNAISGAGMAIMQLFIFHRIAKKLSLIKTLRLGLFLSIPLFLSFPFVNLIARRNKIVSFIILIFLYLVRVFSGQCSFSSVMTLINNSADFKHMGAINGLGQSSVAFFRSIAPLFGGLVLAWGFSNGLPFPLNQYLIFIFMALIISIVIIISFKLPTSLNFPKETNTEKTEVIP
jgi:MFS family permease